MTGRAGRWVSPLIRAAMFALVCVALAALAHRDASGAAPAAWAVAAAIPVLTLLALPLTRGLRLTQGLRPPAARKDHDRAAFGPPADSRPTLLRSERLARPFPMVGGAMVVFQAGLHVVFGLTATGEGHYSVLDRLLCQGSSGHHASVELTRRFLALHPGATRPGAGSSVSVDPHHLLALMAPGTSAGLLMLGAHLVAAVAAAGWLHRTDAAVSKAGALVTTVIATGRRFRAGRRPVAVAMVAAALGAHSSAATLSRGPDQPPPATAWWFRTPARRGPPIFA
ncbi:MAG: hypothetical protein ACQSGP_29735 [Frankia sp.]